MLLNNLDSIFFLLLLLLLLRCIRYMSSGTLMANDNNNNNTEHFAIWRMEFSLFTRCIAYLTSLDIIQPIYISCEQQQVPMCFCRNILFHAILLRVILSSKEECKGFASFSDRFTSNAGFQLMSQSRIHS